MARYEIAPYGNRKYEVQNLTTLDPYQVIKGRYDTYAEAEKAVAHLCNICHQPKPCPMEVEKASGTALPVSPSSANPP